MNKIGFSMVKESPYIGHNIFEIISFCGETDSYHVAEL